MLAREDTKQSVLFTGAASGENELGNAPDCTEGMFREWHLMRYQDGRDKTYRVRANFGMCDPAGGEITILSSLFT